MFGPKITYMIGSEGEQMVGLSLEMGSNTTMYWVMIGKNVQY